MKRLAAIWIVCSVVSLGSFGVLMLVDRRLGVPAPHSVPAAFATMLVAAPALCALIEWLRQRRPIVVQPVAAPVADPPFRATATLRRRPAQGIVLLDCSRPIAVPVERAA